MELGLGKDSETISCKRDIGHVFFVYDFKFTGEHRVRLVFDGSRQNPEKYSETDAPTARGESTRLFHIFVVEERWVIAQYEVPQWLPWRVLASTGPVLHSTHFFFGYYGTMEGTVVVPVGTMGSMGTMGTVVLWRVLR
jgi:hypothetical protein